MISEMTQARLNDCAIAVREYIAAQADVVDSFEAMVSSCSSQAEAARLLGISPRYLSELLSGRKTVKPATYLKLIQVALDRSGVDLE